MVIAMIKIQVLVNNKWSDLKPEDLKSELFINEHVEDVRLKKLDK